MATLLRNTLRTGVLDKRALSPRPKPKPATAPAVVVDLGNKPTSSHNEYTPTTKGQQQQQLLREEARASSPSPRMPPGSWDSHMHILDADRYPLCPTAVYRPSKHTVAQAVAFEASVGASNVVLVQPSIYGHDNACLLDALRLFGPARARGVVAFDTEHTPPATLRAWHELGVRGVRLNLQSTGQTMSQETMRDVLRRYADAVRPLGWVIQLYIPLAMVKALVDIVPTLGVRICIDHMGSPSLPPPRSESAASLLDPYSLDGFGALVRLLQGGLTYVKLSAPYRISKRQGYVQDVEPMAREMLRAAPTRVVFATDWPHTRFEGLDITPWMQQVMDWCGDQRLRDRVFRANAEELWA